MRARILGTGSYLPARVVKNEEIAARTRDPTSDSWIRERLGIVERRYAAPEEETSDLAVFAARRALDAAGRSPNELDGIICAIGIGDVPSPATACYVQAKLGVENRCFAFDIKMACAGTLAGLHLARGLIEAGLAKHLLIVGTHVMSRTALDPGDRGTAPIFGDGAGAVVVGPSDDERGILVSRLYSDGQRAELVVIPGGGTREPPSAEMVAAGRHYLRMDGRAVWDTAVQVVPEVIGEVLGAAGLRPEELDFVIGHQANRRLLEEILRVAGLDRVPTHTNMERYGNTVAASVLIALDESVRAGKIEPGARVLLTAIGAGMSWGALIARW